MEKHVFLYVVSFHLRKKVAELALLPYVTNRRVSDGSGHQFRFMGVGRFSPHQGAIIRHQLGVLQSTQ